MDEFDDYEDDGPTEGAFKVLGDLIIQRAELQLEAARADDAAKAAKEKLRQVAERELPDQMRAMGLSKFETASGQRVALREITYAKIANVRQDKAFKWLDANGHGKIVKRQIVLELPQGDENPLRARDLEKACGDEMLEGVTIKESLAVNAQTLSALVRELEAEGIDVPRDLLGVFVKSSVTVK